TPARRGLPDSSVATESPCAIRQLLRCNVGDRCNTTQGCIALQHCRAEVRVLVYKPSPRPRIVSCCNNKHRPGLNKLAPFSASIELPADTRRSLQNNGLCFLTSNRVRYALRHNSYCARARASNS